MPSIELRKQFESSFRGGALLLALTAMLPALGRAQYRLNGPIDVVAYPSVIVYNGKVVTMDDVSTRSNAVGKIVEAMAVRGEHIVALGRSEDLLKYAGPNTLKVDLKGRTVMPGFINTHIHINLGVANKYFQDHPEAWNEIARRFRATGETPEELTAAIKLILTEQMKGVAPGIWAVIDLPGRNEVGTEYLIAKHITRKELDQWSPKNPVMLRAGIYMTNSPGLAAIPAMTGTGDPPAVPDEDGLGNMRYYNSMMFVNAYFHSPERVKILAEELRKGLEITAAAGITTHGSSLEGLRFWDAFKHLAMQGPMPIRSALSLRTGFYDNMNAPGFVRRLGDLDGLGTPYMWSLGLTYGSNDANAPNICSNMEAPAEVKKKGVCKATTDRNGPSYLEGMYWAIRNRHRIALAHSAGDKAVDLILDQVERAMRDDPSITLEYVRSRRHTTDHCTFYPSPTQIPRLARLGFVLSCGGGFDGRARILAKYFNMSYSNWMSPIKSMVDAGIMVAYEGEGAGGDSYLGGGISLMTRKTSDGTSVAPQEAIDRNTFAKMVTSWAAHFVGKPDQLGTLEAGKLADFVILNKDYFTVPLEELNSTKPLLTAVGGRIVFLHGDLAQELGIQPVGPQGGEGLGSMAD